MQNWQSVSRAKKSAIPETAPFHHVTKPDLGILAPPLHPNCALRSVASLLPPTSCIHTCLWRKFSSVIDPWSDNRADDEDRPCRALNAGAARLSVIEVSLARSVSPPRPNARIRYIAIRRVRGTRGQTRRRLQLRPNGSAHINRAQTMVTTHPGPLHRH